MNINIDLEKILCGKTFGKSFLLTLFYIIIGLILLSICLIIADQAKKNSFFYFFYQNIGIFFFFISLLVAYSGVHKINTIGGAENISAVKLFIETGKRSHYIVLTALTIILSICAAVAIQIGISMISEIPYAGPIIIILLTIPMLMFNFCLLVISLCVIVLFPPMVGENKGFNEIIKKFIGLIKAKGLYILIYTLFSLAVFYIFLKMVYFVTGYSAGITKAMQWKVSVTYPVMVENFVLNSYMTDILSKIGPEPDTLEMLRKYGIQIFNYIDIIKYSLGIFFYIAIAFIFSFPFALYFTVMSKFYKKIGE